VHNFRLLKCLGFISVIVFLSKHRLRTKPMGKLSRENLQLGSLINDQALNCRIYIGYNVGDLIVKEVEEAQKSVKICAPFVSGSWLEKLTAKKKDCADFEVLLITCVEQFKQPVKSNSEDRKNNDKEVKDKNTSDDKAANKDRYVKKLSEAFKILKDTGAKICLYETLGAFDYDGEKFKKIVKEYLQLHAKIYLIDDKILYLCSGNFGRGGMKTNLEFRVRIEREQKTGLAATEDLFCKVIELFDKLGSNNCNLKCEDVTL